MWNIENIYNLSKLEAMNNKLYTSIFTVYILRANWNILSQLNNTFTTTKTKINFLIIINKRWKNIPSKFMR